MVNCLTGMRSKVAFSLLAKHGIESKIFVDNFMEFKGKGYKVVDYKEWYENMFHLLMTIYILGIRIDSL